VVGSKLGCTVAVQGEYRGGGTRVQIDYFNQFDMRSLSMVSVFGVKWLIVLDKTPAAVAAGVG